MKRSLAARGLVAKRAKRARLGGTLRLNSGGAIPTVQLGTYRMKGVDCRRACRDALASGRASPPYTGLDTASIYGNEPEIGAFLSSEACPPRSSLFVQTKLWRSHQGSPKAVAKALRTSLRKLKLDSVDLWLLHWPGPGRHLNRPPVRKAKPSWASAHREVISGNGEVKVPADWSSAMRLRTWRHMAALTEGPEAGARAIGVCNFSARQLQELCDFCDSEGLPLPAVVQNEMHPLLPAVAVRELCRSRGIVFQAYASLGSGVIDLLSHPEVVAVAEAAGRTPAQCLLRWAVQHGCAVVPKSCDAARQRENAQILDFELGVEEMKRLDELSEQKEGQNTMVGWLREHDPDFY